MTAFKSLVVMDLESSGLPSIGKKTKITELSFVGVLVKHVRESNKKGEAIPRVLQKLNLCFYPQKLIEHEATEMTGLDNFMLEEIPIFDYKAIGMLSSFLHRLPLPVCLVAHNGMKFDFPLLKAELAAKNEMLPEGILCADSLMAFRSLFPTTSWVCSPSAQAFSLAPSQIAVSPIKICTNEAGDSKANASTTLSTNSYCQSVSDLQKINETTPKHSRRPDCHPPLKRRSLEQNDENTEHKNGMIRKKLFKGHDKPDSHKLIDLYHFICGREQAEGHQAENDTVALLECIVATAPECLEWIESNHLNFAKIPCMW